MTAPEEIAAKEPETCPHCCGALPNYDAALTALAAVTKERDEAVAKAKADRNASKAASSALDAQTERWNSAKDRAEAAEARCAELVKWAVARDHPAWCGYSATKKLCTCGLSAALESDHKE